MAPSDKALLFKKMCLYSPKKKVYHLGMVLSVGKGSSFMWVELESDNFPPSLIVNM